MIKLSIFGQKHLRDRRDIVEWLFPITKLSPEVSEVKNVKNWDRSFDQLFLWGTWLNYRFSVEHFRYRRDIVEWLFPYHQAIPQKFQKWKMFKTGIGHLTLFLRNDNQSIDFRSETLQVQEGHSGMTFPITKLSPRSSGKWKCSKTGIGHLDQLFLEGHDNKLSIFGRTLQVQEGHRNDFPYH